MLGFFFSLNSFVYAFQMSERLGLRKRSNVRNRPSVMVLLDSFAMRMRPQASFHE